MEDMEIMYMYTEKKSFVKMSKNKSDQETINCMGLYLLSVLIHLIRNKM